MNRRTRAWLTWAAASLVGGLLLALPDQDNRVFSFSEGHGPSPLDLLGAVLLVAGWLVLDRFTWTRRERVRARVGSRALVAAGVALVFALGVIGWSVATDTGAWWAVGGFAAAAIQVAAAAAASWGQDAT